MYQSADDDDDPPRKLEKRKSDEVKTSNPAPTKMKFALNSSNSNVKPIKLSLSKNQVLSTLANRSSRRDFADIVLIIIQQALMRDI